MPVAYRQVFPAYGLPEPRLEYAFAAPDRKFRWDVCWPMEKGGGVALEIDGGVWNRGRHVRGAGYLSDRDKDTEGMLRGWVVVHCTPETMTSEKTIALLKRALKQKGWKP